MCRLSLGTFGWPLKRKEDSHGFPNLGRFSREPLFHDFKFGFWISFAPSQTSCFPPLLSSHSIVLFNLPFTHLPLRALFSFFSAQQVAGMLGRRKFRGHSPGFYSGAVIGHDHSLEFRSFGVYHNLFLEHVPSKATAKIGWFWSCKGGGFKRRFRCWGYLFFVLEGGSRFSSKSTLGSIHSVLVCLFLGEPPGWISVFLYDFQCGRVLWKVQESPPTGALFWGAFA